MPFNRHQLVSRDDQISVEDNSVITYYRSLK